MSTAILYAVTDRRLLLAAAFVRAVATGLVGVLAGLYLARLGLDPAGIGLIVALGLAGGAVASLLALLFADTVGRRAFLAALGALLAVAAFVGMLNGMGRDRGAALVLEQAALPATAAEADRTGAFAAYNVLQD